MFPSVYAAMQRSVSLDERSSGSVSQVDTDYEETFRAFTETVEALALQKSVIGELYKQQSTRLRQQCHSAVLAS